MADVKRATPAQGSVRTVEWGICANCHGDIFQAAPPHWWHFKTGLTQCPQEEKNG